MVHRHISVNEYQQLAILGTTSSHITEAWGDKMLEKREGMCRVGLLNPSGFTLSGGSAKDDQLRDLMKTMQVDIIVFRKSMCAGINSRPAIDWRNEQQDGSRPCTDQWRTTTAISWQHDTNTEGRQFFVSTMRLAE
jgi:hypothetical protein